MKNKGTFKGIEEKIPYLKELGITALELMPVYEFEEVVVPEHVDGNPYGDPEPTGKLNYWGYTKGFYFAPKASYASGRKKEPVREFKELVRALHKTASRSSRSSISQEKRAPTWFRPWCASGCRSTMWTAYIWWAIPRWRACGVIRI